MEKFDELFDLELVENISNLIEEKMKVLNDVSDFKKKEKMFLNCMENFQNDLSNEQQDKFDNVMRYNYELEDYYLTLAYLLGMKYGKNMDQM